MFRVSYQITIDGSIDVEANSYKAAANKVENSNPDSGWDLLMPENDHNEISGVTVEGTRALKPEEVRDHCWRKPERKNDVHDREEV
jgi:hypothetical protein